MTMKERRLNKAKKVGQGHKVLFPVHPRNKIAFAKVPGRNAGREYNDPVIDGSRAGGGGRGTKPVGWGNTTDQKLNRFHTKRVKQCTGEFARANHEKNYGTTSGSDSFHDRVKVLRAKIEQHEELLKQQRIDRLNRKKSPAYRPVPNHFL